MKITHIRNFKKTANNNEIEFSKTVLMTNRHYSIKIVSAGSRESYLVLECQKWLYNHY